MAISEAEVLLILVVLQAQQLNSAQNQVQWSGPHQAICPNTAISVTCVSPSMTLTVGTTCSKKTATYVKDFNNRENITLCNGEEVTPTFAVRSSGTLEDASTNSNSNASFVISIVGTPPAPSGATYYATNHTLQWRPSLPCDHTIVSEVGVANLSWKLDCTVSSVVFNPSELSQSSNLTFQLQSENCAGRSVSHYSSLAQGLELQLAVDCLMAYPAQHKGLKKYVSDAYVAICCKASQLKVKGMTLIFKQPINLGKDAQSDVESRCVT
ncbi:hypothetical protein EMCRGX_G013230 [Ephydatia muelleri]